MTKTFSEITAPGELSAPIGAKTTVINTGSTTVSLIDRATENALVDLSAGAKRGVVLALHSLLPGQTKPLTAGTYSVDFQASLGRSVVVLIEVKQ